MTLLFSSGNATVTISGKMLTDYEMLLPVMFIVFCALSCVMAVVLSFNTIPDEYERRTYQLILVRGISMSGYHCELAFANILAGCISHAILFVGIMMYILVNGHKGKLVYILPAYLFSGIGVVIASLLTTWLSVVLPKMAAGTIAGVIMMMGIFYPLAELLKGLAGGFSGKLLKGMLFLIPDLYGIESAAEKLLVRHNTDWHIMFVGLLYVYLFTVGIILCRRKEESY